MGTGAICALIWLSISAVSLGVIAILIKRAPEGEEIPGVGFRYTNSAPVAPSQDVGSSRGAFPKDNAPAAQDSILSHSSEVSDA